MKTSAVRRGLAALGLLAGLAAVPAFAAHKNPVVAVVNGSDVHLSDVAEFQRGLSPRAAQAPFSTVLQMYVTNRLVAQEAEKEGFTRNAEVRREVHMAELAAASRAMIAHKVKAEATESALKALYKKDLANFKPQEEVHARHILVSTKAEAEAIIAQLKGGANFEELAKTKSKDPTAAKNGGDLGYFAKNEMVPAFADAAFALKPGQVSKPIKTQFGWHVIKVEDRRMSKAPSFEEAKPMLREQMASQVVRKLVDHLREKAKVKLFNADGTPMADGGAK